MHPLILILVAFACIVGCIGFSIVGLDNWHRGNRWFALFMLGLGGFCAWTIDLALDAMEVAYVERMEAAGR